jgi:protein ImuB
VIFERRGKEPLAIEVRPAEATEDLVLLLDLVRLRMEGLDLRPGVTDVAMKAAGERTVTEQLHLFAEAPRRDRRAADRALARVRAELGDEAVCQVCLQPGHLPERRFELVPLQAIGMPESSEEPVPAVAVRRFFPQPRRITGPPEASRHVGPHVLCGGWWVREVHRDYHLVETADDRLLWIFYDHHRRRWYVHGEF